jgi:hypothetical protein
MKLAWISTAALFMSMSAFAACPSGTQGSSRFSESAANVKRILNQNLRPGSHADENDTDGRPLRLLFGQSHGNVTVTVYRSTGGPKHFDNKAIGPVTAEVCAGGGRIIALADGYQIPISKKSGGLLSITLASYGTYEFHPLTGGVEVANGDDNDR